MLQTVDKYLSTLLTFAHGGQKGRKSQSDYVSLIHVPVEGSESVYSVSFDRESPMLSMARYQETVWEYVRKQGERRTETQPRVDVLRAEIDADHPVFEFLSRKSLERCETFSDGQPGLEYFLLMWQRDGVEEVIECWEPYGRQDFSWMTLIGALQALSSQYEYALLDANCEMA